MGIVTYNLTNWEQGSINISGDTSSSSRIRTPDYIELTPSTYADYKITAIDTNGNSLRWNPMLYNASKQCIKDGGWINSGETWSNTDQAKYARFCLSYSSGDISPSNLGSCVFEYDAHIHWLMNDGDYPFLESLPQNLTVMNEPYSITLMTQKANEYPKYDNLKLLKFNSPYPIIIMIQKNNEYPFFEQLKLESLGAFKDAINLQSVIIPKSVKKIGPYSFANTKLTSVTIARDCEYYPTSFPSGCQINFYEE